MLADGAYFGAQTLTDPEAAWDTTITAETACTLMVLDRGDFGSVAEQSGSLQDHLREFAATAGRPRNRGGENAELGR